VDTAKAITHISLCAGYGGIDIGLKRCLPTLRTILVSEIEAYAVANLVAKMEAGQLDPAPIWTDLKTLPLDCIPKGVSILSGGFPCQPFSSAGKREGDEDPRHLFPYIKNAIRTIQPRIVFLENVEGIISAKLKGDEWSDPAGTPVLLHVIRELERVGYRATAGVFSASECGAPHQRKRVFILARRNEGPPVPTDDCRSRVSRGEIGERAQFELANSKSQRLEGHLGVQTGCSEPGRDSSQPKGQIGGCNCGGTPWPALKGEPQHEWEEPRVVFRLGGATDGVTSGLDPTANRVDRLRLLGNGVVPDTCEVAFRTLYKELVDGDNNSRTSGS